MAEKRRAAAQGTYATSFSVIKLMVLCTQEAPGYGIVVTASRERPDELLS